jgi:hypothetical protein
VDVFILIRENKRHKTGSSTNVANISQISILVCFVEVFTFAFTPTNANAANQVFSGSCKATINKAGQFEHQILSE